MRKYENTVVLRCTDADTRQALESTEDGRDIVADHIAAIASFTARFQNGEKIENHRFGVVLTMDGESIATGSLTHPAMVNAIFEELVIMFAKMGGPILMHQVAQLRREMFMQDLVDHAERDIGVGCENRN